MASSDGDLDDDDNARDFLPSSVATFKPVAFVADDFEIDVPAVSIWPATVLTIP